MKRKNFNIIASISAFALGAIYLFSDGASLTANVIGYTDGGTGFAQIMGIMMIMGSMVLFEVSMTTHDHKNIELERLIRGTKNHEEIYNKDFIEPQVEMHVSQREKEHKK